MRIVIAGVGLVGWGLTMKLTAGKHDVVVVDKDRDVCERIYSQLGVTTIHGSATDINTLEEAELDRADCAVAAMRRDSDNLCFTVLAKHMEAPRVIVRMRDLRYADAYKLAGADRVLNIVELYINQFTWEIEEPAMQELTALGEGQASIVFVRVPEESKAAGRTVAQIADSSGFPKDCVIAGIFRPRDAQFIIPRGPVTIEAGDRVYMAANADDIRRAARYLGVR
ncbi:MAG: TrkA family potassium uptake protein [Planctomycetes bacterium]|nr:TrkA family potassium uptake protein [Planctomycetota bacterium]